MFYKGLGLLTLCLYLEAILANPMQGSQHKSCRDGSCATVGTSALQNRVVETTTAFEEEDEEDDEPLQKHGHATGGASFAQAGMKSGRKVMDEEEEDEDNTASSQQWQPRRSVETRGMVLLQHAMKTAANKNRKEVVEEDGIQEDSSD